MRPLADPLAIQPGLAAWIFLLVVCVLVPVTAVRQYRTQPAPAADVSPVSLYASGLVTHAVLLVLVWSVARSDDVTIFPAYRFEFWHLGVGALSLASALLPFLRHRPMDATERQRARQIAPRSRRELGAFYGLSVSAGFTEEMAYRGVLFVLLHALTGSFVLAALLGGAAFGAGHLVQGLKAAGVATLVGIRDHVVVWLTGTLWIAIVVHIVHDMVAGTLLGARLRSELDGVAAAPATPVTPAPETADAVS
jgi:membrane protease YdiL (CAAX protease family)